MDHDDLVAMLDTLVRNGRTIDGACDVLRDLNETREQVLRARAAYEVRVGLITQLELPHRFIDPKRVKGWYAGPLERDRFWPALKRKLRKSRPPDVVDSIDQASTRVVSLLPAPGQTQFRSKGLVVGYIQSGKTANYSAVIAKAADVSYRFIIVLSGMHNPLRAQTQKRLQRELSDLNRAHWVDLTTTDEDFRPPAANVDAFLTDLRDQRILCIVKKNATVLRRLKRWLDSASDEVLANCPVLVIDDEADVASPNAGPSAERRTRINSLLVDLLESLPRVAYVGYTATPFANVLVDPSIQEDLYPRDFIVDLPRPDDYFGPERIFGRDRLDQDQEGLEFEGLDMIRTVPDDEVQVLKPSGPGTKDSFQPELTPSLREALHYFWLASAARAARGQGDEHSSMLIHTTMYVIVHDRFRELIEIERSRLHLELIDPDSPMISVLRDQWERETARVSASDSGERPVSFDDLRPYLPDVVSGTIVVVENGQSAQRLEYGDEGQRQIVIGGNTLARGLTLEGLVVSFFVRSASAYDTLLQMGRWFGYRGGYVDLPRIWMTLELQEWFADLATIEQEIRYDIERYEREGLTPLEFGIRIRRHPQMAVTSNLKMRSAVECEISYSNQMVQTILFKHRDQSWLRDNLRAGRELLQRVQARGCRRINGEGRLLFLNVPVTDIRKFLEHYHFHENATQLRAEQLLGYIHDQNALGDLLVWDVGVVGRRSGPDTHSIELAPEISVPMIERSRIPGPHEYANLKAITSQRDREIREALLDDQGELEGNGERGLLLLYPIDKDSRPAEGRSSRAPLEAVETLLGVALKFPPSKIETPQSYVTADFSRVERQEEEVPEDDIDGTEEPAA